MTEAATAAAGDVVLDMWQALSRWDWNALKAVLSADCLYVDMPIPALAARGPDDIVKRLRLLMDRLAGYEHHDGRLLADGPDVMYEHSEMWTFASGEQGTLKLVTVHRVVDGKVTVWKDYWDMTTLMGFAPAGYFDSFAADMSWAFDATGLV